MTEALEKSLNRHGLNLINAKILLHNEEISTDTNWNLLFGMTELYISKQVL